MKADALRAYIRAANRADTAVIRQVILDMLADSPLAFGERLEEARARTEDQWEILISELVSPPARAAFIASDEIGACGLICADADFPEAGADTVVVSRVWVAPRQRGKGLGRRLMEAATGWAHARNAARIGLGVTEMNVAAIQFYQHLGYHDLGLRYVWPPDPEKRIIVMGLDLQDEARGQP